MLIYRGLSRSLGTAVDNSSTSFSRVKTPEDLSALWGTWLSRGGTLGALDGIQRGGWTMLVDSNFRLGLLVLFFSDFWKIY